jgi:hypothetical protein
VFITESRSCPPGDNALARTLAYVRRGQDAIFSFLKGLFSWA